MLAKLGEDLRRERHDATTLLGLRLANLSVTARRLDRRSGDCDRGAAEVTPFTGQGTELVEAQPCERTQEHGHAVARFDAIGERVGDREDRTSPPP